MVEAGAQATLLHGDRGASGAGKQTAQTASLNTGWLVTNHLNLEFMLGSGLLLPRAGFGRKYFADSSRLCPGYLPLFTERVPRAAIEEATSEPGRQLPVLVEVDLAGCRGTALSVGSSGGTALALPGDVSQRDWGVLVPAPLHAGVIRSIVFRSPVELEVCKASASELENVPLQDFKLRRVKRLFDRACDVDWPSEGVWPKRDVESLNAAQAVGGVMALLYHLADRSPLGVDVCRAAFEPRWACATVREDSILVALPEWIRTGRVEPDALRTPGASLFWGGVERLVSEQGRDPGCFAEDVLIEHLLGFAEREREGRAASAARELAHTLDEMSGLSDLAISELFRRHRRPVSRAMILLCLRNESIDLIEPNFDTRMLTGHDWLAAGILFGVREGWLGLPRELRSPSGLWRTVTHRMAALAHRLDGSDFDLGEAPPRIKPLRELFGPPAQWDAKRRGAAVQLARSMKWNCVRTTVSLGRGAYEFRIEGGSMHIDFEGEPKVRTDVDGERFVDLLGRTRLDAAREAAFRKRLGG